MNIHEILNKFNLSDKNISKLNLFFDTLIDSSYYNDLELFLKKENIPFSSEYIIKSLIENEFIVAASTSHGINIFIFKDNNKKGFVALQAFSRLRTRGPEFHIKVLIEIVKNEKQVVVEKKIDLTESISTFLSLSRNVKDKSIIECFKLLSLPFSSGSGLKEDFILDILYRINIYAYYDKDIGIVVPASVKKKKVISSHIDLIPKFNKIFLKDYSCVIDNDIISGALDNTLTNTILLMLIISNPNIIENTEVVFTEGEETDLHGMKNYISKYGKNAFFINLDVTSDNWSANQSIEYDRPNYNLCKTIAKLLDNPGFTKDRDCDDFDEVDKVNGFGFSYCIPTKKTIHSIHNYTLISKLEPYFFGLLEIIKIDIKDMSYDIRSISIKKALSMKKKDFLKKTKRKKTMIDGPTGLEKVSNKTNGNYFIQGPNGLEKVTINNGVLSEDIFEQIELIESVLMENSIEFSDNFRANILASIEMQEGFKLDTFINYLNKEDHYENVISVLEDSNLIKVENGLIYFY